MKRLQVVLMVFTALIMPIGGAAQVVSTPAPENQVTIGGNAGQFLPEGKPGEVSVIAHSVPVNPRDSIGWIVKNNTNQTISEIVITADLLTPGGKLLGVANKSSISVEQLTPGEMAIGMSDGANIADPSIQMSFHISYEIGPRPRSFLKVVEIVADEQTKDRIIGEFTNVSEVTLDDVYFYYACFDETGKLLSVDQGNLEGKFAPSESRAFQVMVNREECSYFLIGGFSFT